MNTKIVVVGGGFAGVYTYLSLHKSIHGKKNISVIFVSNDDRFIFTPMIHEVAAGNLLPSSIIQPLRTLPQCCIHNFILGNLESVNPDQKVIRVSRLRPPSKSDKDPRIVVDEITFDYLVLATGSETEYYNISGAKEYSLPLKTLYDAKKIKNTIIERFEQAQTCNSGEDLKRKLLSFTIIGGGPTGVEITAEIADLINNEIKDAFPDLVSYASVNLIQAGPELLPHAESFFVKGVTNILEKTPRVRIFYNARITQVGEDFVKFGEDVLATNTVIWTAGVRARHIEIDSLLQVEKEVKTGRIKVLKTLQLPSYKNIFVAGDAAYIFDKENEQAYPMRAQFAVREGELVGKNIANLLNGKKLDSFEWSERGFIVSLGKGGAFARVFSFNFSGFFAWVIYRVAYISSIVGVSAKLRTALDWSLNLFMPRNIAKD